MRFLFFAALLVSLCPALAQPSSNHLRQWQNNKYSMFIHFGVYSELGGVWQGKNVTVGYSEQIQAHGHIFSDEYERVASQFVPSKWNADSVALLAKRAGMRSIVITSKHHDGFCMFKTATTKFNIVDATPFKRDVVKELSDACRRHGLSFGLYFSIIDWHYPQAYPTSSHNADFVTPEHHEFSKRQLRELLTNYGPISELWFDMGSQTVQQSSELRALVKQLQPDCLISGRLGNDQGDFVVMGDNEYPDYKIVTPWQVPASMYDETWGYRSWQEHVSEDDKVKEKLVSLIKTVARGGNYLLNIGPKGDGSVTDFEKTVLGRMGEWLEVNGESIYGTTTPDIEPPLYTELTTKENKIYLHVFDYTPGGDVVLNGLVTKVKRVYPLDAPGSTMNFRQSGATTTFNLPEMYTDTEPARVIVFELDGPLVTKSEEGKLIKTGTTLSTLDATPQYSLSGIDYYGTYRSTARYRWLVRGGSGNTKAGIIYSEEEKGRDFVLRVDGKNVPISLRDGQSIPLTKLNVKWDETYVAGELHGLIGRLHGRLETIDVKEPWGDLPWVRENDGALIEKPTTMIGNWYWYSEITADNAGDVVVRVPLNDGVAVYLNGRELFMMNNDSKDPSRLATLVLPLKSGVNQLLVKHFNRFGMTARVGVERDVPQVMYSKELPPLDFGKGKSTEILFQLPEGVPVHRNVDAPNVKITF